jgi:hypothetical protein
MLLAFKSFLLVNFVRFWSMVIIKAEVAFIIYLVVFWRPSKTLSAL